MQILDDRMIIQFPSFSGDLVMSKLGIYLSGWWLKNHLEKKYCQWVSDNLSHIWIMESQSKFHGSSSHQPVYIYILPFYNHYQPSLTIINHH
jgi:hypothetical protein